MPEMLQLKIQIALLSVKIQNIERVGFFDLTSSLNNYHPFKNGQFL